jgi:hypothetical protein
MDNRVVQGAPVGVMSQEEVTCKQECYVPNLAICLMKNDDMVSILEKMGSPDPDLSCLVECPNLLQASTRHPSLCLVEDPSG